MKQSKLESMIEITLNIGSGFIISMLLWSFVVSPYFNIESTIQDNFYVTLMYTLVSLVRSYFWRRFFANEIHRVMVTLLNTRRNISDNVK